MVSFFSFFVNQIKIYGQSPNVLAGLVFLSLETALFLIGAFFLPFFFIIISFFVFLGIAVFTTIYQFKLARLTSSFRLIDKEFETLVGNMGDGVLVYDSDFKIISLNRAAEEILNLKAFDLVGQNIDPSFIKKPRFKVLAQVIFPSLAPAVTQISEGGWPQIIDIEIENPSLKLRTTLNRVVDERGELIGFLKLIRDQTREKAIIQSKSEFITVAAHQLRTPLTGVHWAFENLVQNEEKPDLREVCKEGLRLAERSLKIINDLLDVAKIEEGRFGSNPEELSLNEVLRQVLDQTKSLAQEYGVKVYFAPDGEFSVMGDAERLNIAFSNLVDNAIKYNIKGGVVTVSLSVAPDKKSVKITIKDTGVGVPEEETAKIFTNFYRGTNVIPIEPNGSGLGLYITKNIIAGLGGEIGFESVIGRGSTFWATLPIVNYRSGNKNKSQ